MVGFRTGETKPSNIRIRASDTRVHRVQASSLTLNGPTARTPEESGFHFVRGTLDLTVMGIRTKPECAQFRV